MKARVKATGEIVDVKVCDKQYAGYIGKNGLLYWKDELDFEVTDKDVIYNKGWQDGWDEAVKSEIPKIYPKLKGSDPDYWTRLEHQYAGMAMQGMVRTIGHDRMYPPDKIAIYAVACANALVEKLKEEK